MRPHTCQATISRWKRVVSERHGGVESSGDMHARCQNPAYPYGNNKNNNSLSSYPHRCEKLPQDFRSFPLLLQRLRCTTIHIFASPTPPKGLQQKKQNKNNALKWCSPVAGSKHKHEQVAHSCLINIFVFVFSRVLKQCQRSGAYHKTASSSLAAPSPPH